MTLNSDRMPAVDEQEHSSAIDKLILGAFAGVYAVSEVAHIVVRPAVEVADLLVEIWKTAKAKPSGPIKKTGIHSVAQK